MLVVGAGPIGVLTALYLARRGYNVRVYEQGLAPAPHGPPNVAAEGQADACNSHPVVLSAR